MNLNAIANAYTRRVTPNTSVTLYQNNGYTVNDEGDQIASFTNEVYEANCQDVSTRDMESLGIAMNQGQYNYIYVNTLAKPISRILQTGQDYFMYVSHNETEASKWLVVRQMENYQGWVKVIVCRQQ